MRGLLWGCTALIAVLAPSIGLNAPAAGNFKGSGTSMVKHESSMPIESIDILNSAPYENALGSVVYGGEIIRTYGSQSRDDGFSTRTHYGMYCRFFALLHTETGGVGLQHADNSPCGRSISRCLAEIFDLYLSTDSIAPIYKFDISIHDRDISSQLPSCCFFCATNEVAGSHPKENGRKSQYDSKGNESFIFPVVDKISEAIPIKVSPSNERGQVIFRLVFGGLFWVLLYAGLKRLGPL